MAVALANYYVALRNAVDKIEGIDRSPRTKDRPKPTLEIPFNDDTLMPF